MIKIESATKERIEAIGKSQKADKILVEKVVRAFMLLEGLAKSDLNFIFKGGTALMLLFHSGKRLSIDIDIIVPNKDLWVVKSHKVHLLPLGLSWGYSFWIRVQIEISNSENKNIVL